MYQGLLVNEQSHRDRSHSSYISKSPAGVGGWLCEAIIIMQTRQTNNNVTA